MTLCDRWVTCRAPAKVFALRAERRYQATKMTYVPMNLCREHAYGNLLKFKTKDARDAFLINEALDEP